MLLLFALRWVLRRDLFLLCLVTLKPSLRRDRLRLGLDRCQCRFDCFFLQLIRGKTLLLLLVLSVRCLRQPQNRRSRHRWLNLLGGLHDHCVGRCQPILALARWQFLELVLLCWFLLVLLLRLSLGCRGLLVLGGRFRCVHLLFLMLFVLLWFGTACSLGRGLVPRR